MSRMLLSLMLVAGVIAGCSKKGPPSLSLEQVPEAIRSAFASARQALRTNAEGIAKLVADKQYVPASLQLQALGATSDLSEEQRRVVAGATIAVNSKLQEMAGAVEIRTEIAAPATPAPAVAT